MLAGQALVDLASESQAVLTGAHVGLARVVRAVGEPDLQVARSGRVHDVDALEVVVDRLPADGRIVGEGAELVLLVLERVRVDGAERDTEVLGVAAQGAVVVDLVPRDVQGDARGEAVTVDLRGVRDLLERVAGVPPVVHTRKRVPELPNAHEGSSMPCCRGWTDVGGEDAHDASLSSSRCAGREAAPHPRAGLRGGRSREGGGGLIGTTVEADEEPAHLGFPARGDLGCREIRLRRLVVVGLVVADQAPAVGEEEE